MLRMLRALRAFPGGILLARVGPGPLATLLWEFNAT